MVFFFNLYFFALNDWTFTLYKLSTSVYGYVLHESVSCVCLWLSDEPVLFCIYVWIIVVFVFMFGWPQGR